eukprot:6453634-Pyramimonas_sp.AAC.1
MAQPPPAAACPRPAAGCAPSCGPGRGAAAPGRGGRCAVSASAALSCRRGRRVAHRSAAPASATTAADAVRRAWRGYAARARGAHARGRHGNSSAGWRAWVK